MFSIVCASRSSDADYEEQQTEGSVRWEVERQTQTQTPAPPVTHRDAHMLPEPHDRFHLLLKGFRLEGNIYIDKGTHMGSVALHQLLEVLSTSP